MKLRFLFSFIFVCAFLLLPSIALGAVKLNLDYPSFGGFNLKDDQNISQLVAWTYYAMIGIAGLAAFVMLVWGGVQWLVSGAIPSQLSAAKEKIQNAILGILLIFGSFIIIQLINPEVGTIGNFEISATQSNFSPQDIVLSRPPVGALEKAGREPEKFLYKGAGIYFCTNAGCACNTDDDGDPEKPGKPRKECSGITKGDASMGNPGIGEGKDDYYYVPIIEAKNTEETLPANLQFKIRSVSIIQGKDISKELAVPEPLGVLLFNTNSVDELEVEDSEIGETGSEVVCFNEGGAGNLQDYLLQNNPSDVGWDQGVGKYRSILAGFCPFPGITLDQKSDFARSPVVFLFDRKNFGGITPEEAFASKEEKGKLPFRRWARPCKYFYLNEKEISIHQVGTPRFEEKHSTGHACAPNGFGDGAVNDWDLLSVWISPARDCSARDGKFYSCAITFYECAGKDPCEDFDPPDEDTSPTKYTSICFSSSEGDLIQSRYSFDEQKPSNDLRNDVNGIKIHASIDDCIHGELSTPYSS